MSETLKPIIDMRAVEHMWTQADFTTGAPIVQRVYRIEFRREGETEWEAAPLIENEGRPNWARL